MQVRIPAAPASATQCNCSICRRLGALWGYYAVEQVQVQGHPEHTQATSRATGR